jgi:ATP-dependent DNA helicase PIF1
MLNEMRYGTLSQRSIARFRQLSREITYEDGIGPWLPSSFPLRQDVDSSNNLRLSRLRGESKTFYAKDSGSAGDEQRKKLLDNFMAQEVLHLTIGAQVMLIKNIDETLVNGSVGIVVAFESPLSFAQEFELSKERGQGDGVERSHSDVSFVGDAPPGPRAAKALSLEEAKKKRPVINFNSPGGFLRRVMLEPETWKVELPSGEIQASRIQVCLL